MNRNSSEDRLTYGELTGAMMKTDKYSLMKERERGEEKLSERARGRKAET